GHSPAPLHTPLPHVLAGSPQPALVEAFLPGREFTAALVGNNPAITVFPLVEICFTDLPPGATPLYSYEAKWLSDTPAQPLHILRCPPDIPAALVHPLPALFRRAL